jgi:hypothetical protein
MFVTVLGVPSPETGLLTGLVRNLVQEATGKHQFIGSRTVDEFRAATQNLECRDIVFANESPDGQLVALLVELRAPLFVVVDDPVAVAIQLHLDRGLELMTAARIVSTCMATLEVAARHPSTRIISASRLRDDRLKDVLAEVADCIPVQLETERLARTLARVAPKSNEVSKRHELAHTAYIEREPGLLALGSYRIDQDRRSIDRLSWPCGVFTIAKQAAYATAEQPIELAGRPRPLLWGPTFGVPMGNWCLTLAFSTRDSFGNTITLRIVSKAPISEAKLALPQEGAFQVSMAFTMVEPKDPVELHVLIDNAAIEGELKVFGVDLKRAGI